MRIKRAFATMTVLICMVPLGLELSRSAQAADFYVFNGSKAYEMVVVEVGEIQISANETRIASLWFVTVGMSQSLDVSKVEMDCRSPRFRVIAETLFDGFRPTARQIDKTGQNSKDWQLVGDGSLFKKYWTAVCVWPNVDGQSTMMHSPDIWTITKAAADFLWDAKAKDEEQKTKR